MWSNFGSCENNEKLGKTLFSQLGHNYAVVIQLCSSCENNVSPGFSLIPQLPKKPVVKPVVKRTTFVRGRHPGPGGLAVDEGADCGGGGIVWHW